jgi:hypothetical protein
MDADVARGAIAYLKFIFWIITATSFGFWMNSLPAGIFMLGFIWLMTPQE